MKVVVSIPGCLYLYITLQSMSDTVSVMSYDQFDNKRNIVH